MSFSSWYHRHYTAWNRTRSPQQPQIVAGTDTNISRVATSINTMSTDGSNNAKDKKAQESLFGPNIGVVSSGPAWTAATEKKVLTDELTPDTVASWVEKSKDTSHPTTTLQALVNLKRPTIRLSPLSSEDPNIPASDVHHYHHHGLEFEYDCDAPKCGIYVHVLLSKEHPDAPVTATSSNLSKLLVFETVVEGGFGKLLKLEEGALLELGRFEHMPASSVPQNSSMTSLTNPTSVNGETPLATDPQATTESGATGAGVRNPRRRFTHFHFRKRSQGRSVSGPALAVVDAEPAPATDPKGKEDMTEGVRITIRLAALDEQGTEMTSPNEQVTYLHVVRFGTPTDTENEEDTRPWVVKVVKREATIGPHTFHLHEIYGLASSASATHTPAPTAPLPSSPVAESHTYPPTDPTSPQPVVTTEEDASSECLLCLSAAREVVLLPCRHLVACKDCALNMVEFGAGGNITQTGEPVPATGGEAAEGTVEVPATTGTDAAPATPTVPPAPATTTTATRRKRKAKGWFCPVCRQPYTSLLRITTTPPTPAEQSGKEAPGPVPEGETSAPANGTGESRNGGLLGSNFTPSFFRGLSFSRSPPTDVESQAGTTRVGA